MAQVLRKRPIIVSIACILGFIWAIFLFGTILAPSVKRLGEWVPAIYGILISLTFISFVGVWYMKRWGAMLFLLSFFGKSLFLIFVDDVNPIGFFFSLVFLVIFICYYRRMDVNL